MTTSMISEQVAELKEYAGARHGEIARICWRAAETIELLAAKLTEQTLKEVEQSDDGK